MPQRARARLPIASPLDLLRMAGDAGTQAGGNHAAGTTERVKNGPSTFQPSLLPPMHEPSRGKRQEGPLPSSPGGRVPPCSGFRKYSPAAPTVSQPGPGGQRAAPRPAPGQWGDVGWVLGGCLQLSTLHPSPPCCIPSQGTEARLPPSPGSWRLRGGKGWYLLGGGQ